MELLHALGIEWKVLIAQVINFGILVFVLNYFLYKPILALLNKRRVSIEETKKREESSLKQKETALMEREALLAETRKESQRILKETEIRSAELSEKLKRDALKEREHLLLEGQKELALLREKLLQDVRKEARALLKESIERSLSDILDKKAGERLVDEAVRVMQKR